MIATHGYCDEAAQYLGRFRGAENSRANLDIAAVVRTVDGLEAPEFVQATGKDGEYRINVTGIDRVMKFRFRLLRAQRTVNQGRLLLQRAP